MATYKIHPGIGVARVGNSPDEFCISPEAPAQLPIACDAQGNPLLSPDGKSELTVSTFKDGEGRIKRQAARFQVFAYDEESPEGRPLEVGDPIKGGGNEGVLVDIQWRVYLANKKSVWYEFRQLEGEHGYAADHPRRNADITDPGARQRLIIDPGPRIVNCSDRRSAQFDRRSSRDLYAPTFPPELKPHSIDTLGGLKTDDRGRLLVLGGHGHSGSYKFDEFGQPRITSYANNDGWFDDTSDGPVMARLVMFATNVQQLRFIDVEYPAWVIAGYPAYVPEILDMVTLEDVLTDLAIRDFGARTDLYGKPGTFDCPEVIPARDPGALAHWKAGDLEWNPGYKPWFYRDIWPILFRPDEYTYLNNVLAQSNYPHNQTTRGSFDPEKLGVPPVVNKRALAACRQACVRRNHTGELFLDALDPPLATIDSEADATLRLGLEAFNDKIQALVAGLESQGQHFEERDKKQYEAWLDALRDGYPKALGDLLFDDFKERVKERVGRFAQSVYAEPGEGAVSALEAVPDLGAKQVLADYGRGWSEAYAAESAEYKAHKTSLEEAIRAIVADLKQQALAMWNRGIEAPNPLARWGRVFVGERDRLQADVAEFVSLYVFDKLANAALGRLKDYRSGKLLRHCERRCVRQATYDPFRDYRTYLYDLLRQPGEENHFRLGGQPNKRTYNLPLMPLLCGDNPITNTLASKFFRLTDYQLFLLRQWSQGLFYNEKLEGWADPDPFHPYAGWRNRTGADLDRGVLFNLLGGSFCPGAEVTWIIRNPAIYREPFRLKADRDFSTFRQTAAQANQQRGSVPDLDYVSYLSTALSQESDFATGLQPGDLTKYMAVPWQSDFNECSTQEINITYEEWNRIFPDSEKDTVLAAEAQVWETMWWPAHRPLQTFEVVGPVTASPSYQMLNWSRGMPGSDAGDLKMAVGWSELGFVVRNPYATEQQLDQASPLDPPKYISVERNDSEEA